MNENDTECSYEGSNRILLGMLVGLGAAAAGAWAISARRSAYSFAGKTVLITGGSRGLGLILARYLMNEGARVAICARDGEELLRARRDLENRAGEVFEAACDVRDQENVERLIQDVRTRFGPVDVLINNAGVIQVGPLATQTQEDVENAMAVHFWGPYYAMKAVIPEMRARGEGRIVTISSIGGKVPVPHLSAYCASKFALAGLSSAMHTELAKDNIKVTTVYPGLMRTGSHINAKFKGQHRKEFALFSLSNATPLSSIDADRAGAKIIEACRRGDAELIITLQAKLAARLYGLAPNTVLGLLRGIDSMLPQEGGIGRRQLPGYESTSAVSPSIVTSLIDEASAQNNELPHGAA
jgi:short-subunit dehydrogenase